jgi:hypothetical protein
MKASTNCGRLAAVQRSFKSRAVSYGFFTDCLMPSGPDDGRSLAHARAARGQLESLFDLLEEDLDLPTATVEVGAVGKL